MNFRTLVAVAWVLVGACKNDDQGAAAPAATADAGTTDVGSDGGALGSAEATIRTALSCGPDPDVGPGASSGMQRFEVDTKRFPDALCNDGSGATFYFRPYKGETNRNKWVLNLHGGGTCGSGPSCAARWCSCDSKEKCPFVEEPTNFSRGTMINAGPPIKDANGIWLRDDPARPNPLGDYNQVVFDYCSSDAWRGSARAVAFTATNPKTGEPATFSLHFLGAKILDANLTTLRQDGVGPLTFSQGGASVAMPDLDDADEVVVSGDSAGGSGVITNLDYMSELLHAKSTRPLKVYGLIDAVVGPDMSKLDYGAHVAEQVRSYEQLLALSTKSPIDPSARHDASCQSWHKANAPGTEAACNDESHVIRHHVTTPFFVRMALRDSLISRTYIDQGLRDSAQQPLTVQSWAVILQGELAKLDQLPSTAEEGAAMTRAPGVFAPGCTKHDTIHSTPDTFGTTITPAGGSALRLLQVFTSWQSGAQPSSVLTQSPTLADTVCP
jgi:hypothetical protein